MLALADLARENGIRLQEGDIKDVALRAELTDDVRLWTYAHEIMRRSLFALQGPAVHRLWREMNPTRRTRLSASHDWACRDRLVAHLRAVVVRVAP